MNYLTLLENLFTNLEFFYQTIFFNSELPSAFYFKLAVDGAFGSYSEASGGRLASLAYTPLTLMLPLPPKNFKKRKENR